jgi:hypothetical protein
MKYGFEACFQKSGFCGVFGEIFWLGHAFLAKNRYSAKLEV